MRKSVFLLRVFDKTKQNWILMATDGKKPMEFPTRDEAEETGRIECRLRGTGIFSVTEI